MGRRMSVLPLGMAAVAGGAGVAVAADLAVVLVGLRLRMLVAVDALERLVVAGIPMAGAAVRAPDAPVSAGVDGEVATVVIEGRPGPGARAVTVLAGGRESGPSMVRIRRPVEVALMARHAVPWRARVAAIRVATAAVRAAMRAGQRESGGVVIERGRSPGAGGMAVLAGGRKSGVARCGRVVFCPMAGHAVGGRPREAAIDVAASAGGALVGAGEGEAGLAVVDAGGGAPGRGRVAVLAVGREPGGPMIWVRRAVVVCSMAREAVGGGSGETAIDVAASAGGALVGAGEGEAGLAVVDVGGGAPGRGRVAVLAVGREPEVR